jgi:hypothetical protein
MKIYYVEIPLSEMMGRLPLYRSLGAKKKAVPPPHSFLYNPMNISKLNHNLVNNISLFFYK